MKQDYIESINRLMENCNDLTLLDLIYRLMKKSSEPVKGGATA